MSKYYQDTVTEFLEGYLIDNSDEKYNNMVVAKELTKIDPIIDNLHALTTCMSKLQVNQNSVFATVQVVGDNSNQTRTITDNIVRDSNKNYVDGLKHIESWRVE